MYVCVCVCVVSEVYQVVFKNNRNGSNRSKTYPGRHKDSHKDPAENTESYLYTHSAKVGSNHNMKGNINYHLRHMGLANPSGHSHSPSLHVPPFRHSGTHNCTVCVCVL